MDIERGRNGPRRESVLTLTVVDPADGRVHEVPLRFLQEDGRVYVLAPGRAPPRWFATALRTPRVRWRIGRKTVEGTATALAEPGAIRDRFESAFGAEAVARWFGSEVAGLALESLPPVAYEAAVEAYFDAAAEAYDALVQANPLDRLLRTASLGILRGCFRTGDRVLEIGSGTGLETLPLAAAGIDVTATDVSTRMLDRLQAKASAAGLAGHVHARHLPARDLGVLEPELGPGAFQGAFSTFGALNCEPAWRELAPVLGRLLAPGAPLVLGVWNRVCLVELVGFGIAGHPRRALARLRSPAPVGLTRFGIPVTAATVREYVRTFAADFEVQRIYGLPVALPPYDWWPRVPNPDVFLPLLAAVDERLRARFPFNRLGDHFVLVLRRHGPSRRADDAQLGITV